MKLVVSMGLFLYQNNGDGSLHACHTHKSDILRFRYEKKTCRNKGQLTDEQHMPQYETTHIWKNYNIRQLYMNKQIPQYKTTHIWKKT